MKFKIFGNGDCPESVLSQIHSTLSGLSSVKLKTFANHVVNVTIANDEVDPENFSGYFQSTEDLKSSYNCVRFLINSAVKNGVTKEVFSLELQQLGLSKEHSNALGKVFEEHLINVTNSLEKRHFSIRKPENVEINETISKTLQFNFTFPENSSQDNLKVNLRNEHANELLVELKKIKQIMEEHYH